MVVTVTANQALPDEIPACHVRGLFIYPIALLGKIAYDSALTTEWFDGEKLQEIEAMTKRLEVFFIPSPSAANAKPREQLVYRGKAKTFDEMWATCASRLPDDLLRANGAGKILVGREGDAWMLNPNPNSPAAVEWSGTAKSGSVQAFLRTHTVLCFTLSEPVTEAMAETSTT
jgi:hypothetical protein